MDSEEIAQRVGKIKLHSDFSDVPLVISSSSAFLGQQRLKTCLVRKVFSAKAVNRETFQSQMPRILQAKKQITIEVVGDNIFLLDFCADSDRIHALFEGTWYFFNDLIVFKTSMGLHKPTYMSFDSIPFWVQCHNVPLPFMILQLLEALWKGLVLLLRLMQERGRCVGKFARIRIELDITKSLRQGIWVQSETEIDKICILLLYERLPNFCYGCGRIGHVLRDCSEKGSVEEEIPFGNWIRASSFSSVRKKSATRGVSPQSNDSLSFPSREREVDINESGELETQCKDRVGTCSSKDKSDTYDNNMCVAETQKFLLPTSDKVTTGVKQMEVVSEYSENQNTDLIAVIKTDKKKWKRLAREKSVTTVENTKHNPNLVVLKISRMDQDNINVVTKRIRVEILPDVEIMTYTAGLPHELCCLECAGLGNPRAIQNLRRLIAESSPSLIFISETKLFSYKGRNWANLLHFP